MVGEDMNWYKRAITNSDERYLRIVEGVVSAVESSFGGKTPDKDFSLRVPIEDDLVINVAHDDAIESFGEYDPDDQTIYMKMNITPDIYYQYLAHEVAHAVQDHLHPRAGFTGEPAEMVDAWRGWRERVKSGEDVDEPEYDTGWLQRAYEDQEIELHAIAMHHMWGVRRYMVEMMRGGQALDRKKLDGLAKYSYMEYVRDVSRENLSKSEDAGDQEVKRLPDLKRRMLVRKYARRIMSAVTQMGQEIFGLGGRGS